MAALAAILCCQTLVVVGAAVAAVFDLTVVAVAIDFGSDTILRSLSDDEEATEVFPRKT